LLIKVIRCANQKEQNTTTEGSGKELNELIFFGFSSCDILLNEVDSSCLSPHYPE